MIQLTTRQVVASFDGRGPVTLCSAQEWMYEREAPTVFAWIHDGFAVTKGSRHPSFPERLCISVKPSRHPFGFWQMEAEFVVERYRWNNLYNQAELITNAWDGPQVKGTGCI